MSFLDKDWTKSGRQLRQFALTTLLFCIPYTASHAACSVHDQGCIYHGFQSDVHTDYPITTDTTAVFYTIGTNPTTGAPSKVDFDNKVWLPSMTGDKMSGSYTTPTGPYIINNTPYGTSNPPADTFTAGDANLLVYPSQYQITFNQNTAVANHTGDFNGGENGNIPNATGCPNMPGAANCEAVVVSGNVPSGFYTQQARVFNSQGNPNPSVEVQMGVYTTGKAVLVVPSHTTITGKTATYTEDAARYTLNGTGATTPATVYEIYNRGFDSTAYGVASFDQSLRRNLGWSAPYWVVNHDNGYQYKMRNHLARIDTMTTSVGASGGFSTAIQKGKVRADGKDVLAVVVPPPPRVFEQTPLSFTIAAGNLASNCKNYIECYQGTTLATMPNGQLELSYGNGVFWDPSGNFSFAPKPATSSSYITQLINLHLDQRDVINVAYLKNIQIYDSGSIANPVDYLKENGDFHELYGIQVVYHVREDGVNDFNRKFVNNKGYEVVLGLNQDHKTYHVVKDPTLMGTFNYGSNPISFEHVTKDIIPYWFFRNSENDTSNIGQRFFGQSYQLIR